MYTIACFPSTRWGEPGTVRDRDRAGRVVVALGAKGRAVEQGRHANTSANLAGLLGALALARSMGVV